MPTLYSRFTEKEAREWRQIYKALQLLECVPLSLFSPALPPSSCSAPT